jgi:cell division protein FtsI/penicillin-binding protein 2
VGVRDAAQAFFTILFIKGIVVLKQLDNSMKIRALCLLGIFFVGGFIPVIIQLFNVTIINHDFYQKKLLNRERVTIINPKRVLFTTGI